MKLRLALALWCALSIARVASAQTPTPATFNPIPQQGASFFTNLYNFLVNESADRDATWESNYTLEPDLCVHGTAAGYVGTFGATCHAMVAGNYTVEPAASLNYQTDFGATSTDFCWVILTDTTSLAIGGWTRKAGTHYMGNCTASGSARPDLGTDHAMYVMGTTITGGAITSVITAAPSYAALFRYTNASELSGNTIAGRLYLPDFGPFCLSDAGGSCNAIPSSDASGCATCGDSATNFWATGTCEPARGCTGITTASSVGVPQIGPTPGVWSVPTAVAAKYGGLGSDFSAVSGSAIIVKTPGVPTSQLFPTTLLRQPAGVWGVDGTQCTKDDTNATFAANVIGSVVACADNSAGRAGGVVSLPSSYSANSAINAVLVSTNTGSDSGVMGFDFTCVCVGDGETLSASNFASDLNLDTTFTGTTGENETTSGIITCGGTCQPDDQLYWRATVDSTATTMPTPTDIHLGELTIEVQNSELSN